MEKAYVGMMGGYVVLKDGDEKHKASHIVLTIDEYNKLIREIKSLRGQLDAEKSEHKKDVKEVNRELEAYKRNVKEGTQSVIDDANKRIVAAEAEAEKQKELNKNLLRITRERANAKRHLQPKKGHCGYRFSGKIMQKTIRVHSRREGVLYKDVWTATLETPYDGTIPIHQIEDTIFEDLKGKGGILSKLYVNYWFVQDSKRLWKGSYLSAVDEKDNPEKKNYLFDYNFMVNPRTHLWEVQITTTKFIQPLAEMMV